MRILHHRWPLLWLCALVLLVGGAGLLWRCAHADPPAPPTLPPARTQRVTRATTPAAAQARLAQQPALRGARWQALDWARVEAQLARLSPSRRIVFRDPSPDGRYLLLLISFQPEAPEGDRRAAVVELPALTLRLLPTLEGQPPTPYYSVVDAVWDPQAPTTLYQAIDQLEPPARDTGPTSQVWRQDIEGGPDRPAGGTAVRLCGAEEEMRLHFVMPRSRQLCASAYDPRSYDPETGIYGTDADYRVLLALDPPAARTRPEWPRLYYSGQWYQNNISPDEQYLYGITNRGQETPQSTVLFYCHTEVGYYVYRFETHKSCESSLFNNNITYFNTI